MIKTNLLEMVAAAALLTGAPVAATASSVVMADPGEEGIPYRWTVNLSGNDSASLARHVGAWSWEDESLFVEGQGTVGWTHNADWVAFHLDTAVVLTIRLERKGDVLWISPQNEDPNQFAGNNLFPGMTLWSGWDNDGGDFHSFNNVGNVDWAEDLSYIGHQAPPTIGDLETRHMIESTFTLGPGDYTLVIGGNSQSTANEGRQGYLATFTTTPVPEPGSALLVAFGGGLCAMRRRRAGATKSGTSATN